MLDWPWESIIEKGSLFPLVQFNERHNDVQQHLVNNFYYASSGKAKWKVLLNVVIELWIFKNDEWENEGGHSDASSSLLYTETQGKWFTHIKLGSILFVSS